jgi:hypothetical protein
MIGPSLCEWCRHLALQGPCPWKAATTRIRKATGGRIPCNSAALDGSDPMVFNTEQFVH